MKFVTPWNRHRAFAFYARCALPVAVFMAATAFCVGLMAAACLLIAAPVLGAGLRKAQAFTISVLLVPALAVFFCMGLVAEHISTSKKEK